MWGGAEEQAAEIVAGNPYAVNWQDKALKIMERTMAKYWEARPEGQVEPAHTNHATNPGHGADTKSDDNDLTHEFVHYCQTLISQDNGEGWSAELQHYLNDMPANVDKDMDLVQYWQK
ncbi:hypothetical protein APHAL10511_005316 [Amanita phalloides]|nr:hypothetical protein APHAL10511_005316 [Amanita phalloides]